MGHRLSRIYTRTGDDGSTGLGDGSRVGKDDLRVASYGTVDEANATLGLLLAVPLPEEKPAEKADAAKADEAKADEPAKADADAAAEKPADAPADAAKPAEAPAADAAKPASN